MEGRGIGMTDVAVVFAQQSTCLGDLDATWDGLMASRSGLTPLQTAGVAGEWPVGVIGHLKGGWGSAERIRSLLDRLIQKMSPLEVEPESALVVATTKGAVDELFKDGDEAKTCQPWSVAHELSRRLGLKGPVRTVSAACASGGVALIEGAMLIKSGAVRNAVIVGFDIISRFVLGGFSGLHALSQEPCRPFDKDRKGLSLGEGAGVLILSSRQEALQRNWPILAHITGMGVACDATHITAPSREAVGLINAILQATENGTRPVGGINAHGTGTLYNDSMELLAFSRLWAGDIPPLHSIKGATGHCLGGAGVIEAGLCVKSLEEGVLPPTVGLRLPESAEGSLSGKDALRLKCPSILSCNSGFGGINSAILFERP